MRPQSPRDLSSEWLPTKSSSLATTWAGGIANRAPSTMMVRVAFAPRSAQRGTARLPAATSTEFTRKPPEKARRSQSQRTS